MKILFSQNDMIETISFANIICKTHMNKYMKRSEESFQPSDGPNDPVIRQRALDEELPTQKLWMVTLVSDRAHEASCKHDCKLAKMWDHSIPICPERTVQNAKPPCSFAIAMQGCFRFVDVAWSIQRDWTRLDRTLDMKAARSGGACKQELLHFGGKRMLKKHHVIFVYFCTYVVCVLDIFDIVRDKFVS